MATKKDSETSMRIRVATGVDGEGKTVFANRSVAYINPEISDENFCSIGASLANLQSHTLSGVIRVDTATFEI